MLRISLQFFAHKKGVGSTKNGRDSESKRLGVKCADGQSVLAGNIIVRQRGTKIHPGTGANAQVDGNVFLQVLHLKLPLFIFFIQYSILMGVCKAYVFSCLAKITAYVWRFWVSCGIATACLACKKERAFRS